MQKSHIIWGNYHPETELLIQELQQHVLDLITVVDEEMESGTMRKLDDVIYASEEYIETMHLDGVTEIHYEYVPPLKRNDGQAWKVRSVNGLVHEFMCNKQR